MSYPKKNGIITKEAILGISDPSVFQSPPPRVFSTFENLFKSPGLVSNSSLSSSVISHPIQTPRTSSNSFLAPSPLIKKSTVKERVPLSINQNQIHISGFKANDDFEKLVSASPVPMFYGCSSAFSEDTSLSSELFPARSLNSEGYSKIRQTFQGSSLKQRALNSDSSFVKNPPKKVLSEKNVNLPKKGSNLPKVLPKKVLSEKNVNLPKQTSILSKNDKDFLISKFAKLNKNQANDNSSKFNLPENATQVNSKKATEIHKPQSMSLPRNRTAQSSIDDTAKNTSNLSDETTDNIQTATTMVVDNGSSAQDIFEFDDTPLSPEEETFSSQSSLGNIEPALNRLDLVSTKNLKPSRKKNEIPITRDHNEQSFIIQGQSMKITRSGRVVSKPRQYWKNEPTPPSTIQISLEWGAAKVKITKLSPSQVLNSPLPVQETTLSNSRTNTKPIATRASKLKRALPSGPSKNAQSSSAKKVQKNNNKSTTKNSRTGNSSIQPKKKANRRNVSRSPSPIIPTLGIASPGILRPFAPNHRDNYTNGLKKTLVSVQSKKQIDACKKKPVKNVKKGKSSALQQVLDGNASHLFERKYDDDSETDSPNNNYYEFSE